MTTQHPDPTPDGEAARRAYLDGQLEGIVMTLKQHEQQIEALTNDVLHLTRLTRRLGESALDAFRALATDETGR